MRSFTRLSLSLSTSTAAVAVVTASLLLLSSPFTLNTVQARAGVNFYSLDSAGHPQMYDTVDPIAMNTCTNSSKGMFVMMQCSNASLEGKNSTDTPLQQQQLHQQPQKKHQTRLKQ